MTEPLSPYEGLTESELEVLVESSAQLPGEDATHWATRAAHEEAEYRALAAKRRADAVAEAAAEPVA